MFEDNPVIEQVNVVAPEVSVTLLLAMVGLAVVLQQTPCSVIVAPPSVVIVPPAVALPGAIALTPVVVKVGAILVLEVQPANSINERMIDTRFRFLVLFPVFIITFLFIIQLTTQF